MAKWQVNNPIRYDVPPQQGGDTVYNGFFKTASEFNTIYNFLNTLRTHRASASPPTDAEVNELWLDTSVNPPTLKRWDGASWVDVKVGVTNFSSNSDKVDGFDASQIPTANTVPVADSLGKISTGWLNASATPTANSIPVAGVDGKIDLGWLKGTWKVIAEVTTSANVDYVDFTGLDINTDGAYKIFATVKNPTSSLINYLLFVNGDFTTTNYYSQILYANGTTVSAGQYNNSYVFNTEAGTSCFSNIVVTRDPDGRLSYVCNYKRGAGTSTAAAQSVGINTVNLSNITSIRISASVSGGIGAGSKFILCKVRS